MPQKNLLEITVDIAAAHIVKNKEIAELPLDNVLLPIYKTLLELRRLELGNLNAMSVEGPVDPEASIRTNDVLCLECHRTFALLCNRHTALHGLTPREYKQKHGIRLTQSLSARTLSAKRRKLAKESGMGKQLAEWRAGKKRPS